MTTTVCLWSTRQRTRGKVRGCTSLPVISIPINHRFNIAHEAARTKRFQHFLQAFKVLDARRCMNDSAGKFCPDEWTRQGKGDKGEGKDREGVFHEDMKEDQDVTASPAVGPDSCTVQPHCSREFTEGNLGHASTRCTRFYLWGRRFCQCVSQTGTSGRSTMETRLGHCLARAGKSLGPQGVWQGFLPGTAIWTAKVVNACKIGNMQ